MRTASGIHHVKPSLDLDRQAGSRYLPGRLSRHVHFSRSKKMISPVCTEPVSCAGFTPSGRGSRLWSWVAAGQCSTQARLANAPCFQVVEGPVIRDSDRAHNSEANAGR